MLHDDRIIFGLLLSKIYVRGKVDLDQEFNYLLRGQEHDLEHNSHHATIEDLKDKFSYFTETFNAGTLKSPDFISWMTSPTPEDQVPTLWSGGENCKETIAMHSKTEMLTKSQ